MDGGNFVIPNQFIDINSQHASIKKKINLNDDYQVELFPKKETVELKICGRGYRKNDLQIREIAYKNTPLEKLLPEDEDDKKVNFELSENTEDLILDEKQEILDNHFEEAAQSEEDSLF